MKNLILFVAFLIATFVSVNAQNAQVESVVGVKDTTIEKVQYRIVFRQEYSIFQVQAANGKTVAVPSPGPVQYLGACTTDSCVVAVLEREYTNSVAKTTAMEGFIKKEANYRARVEKEKDKAKGKAAKSKAAPAKPKGKN